MGFSEKQVAELRRSLNATHIHSREIQGRSLSYIEGWHAIAEANRIFGFDGWDRETVETRCVLGRDNRGSYQAVYVAKVRITVRAEGKTILREGYGAGDAQGAGAGEAHEKALKTAETDATKRALATFGKPFGLSLYVSTGQGRDRSINNPLAGAPALPEQDRRRTQQRIGRSGRYVVVPRARVVLDPTLYDPEITPAMLGAPGPEPATVSVLPQVGRDPQSGSEVAQGAQAPDTSPGEIASPPLQPPSEVNPQDIETADVAAGAEPDSVQRLMINWPQRRRAPEHLKFVRTQPCLICSRTPSDAHHLRFAQSRGVGLKVSDEFTVPLCRIHHDQLHQSGKEVDWWAAMDRDVDPLAIAHGLWEESRSKSESPPNTTER